MRLLKYRVNKFRSIKGTEWIDIEQWSCFVGLNESGKTNLLLPLWKLNPADGATKIDLFEDYPRDEYSQVDSDNPPRENFIEVLFELNDNELSGIKNAYEAYLNPPQENQENGEEQETLENSRENQKEKIKFTKHLFIAKNYSGNFNVWIEHGGDKEPTNIKGHVDDNIFNKIIGMIPKFVYYSEYGNLDSSLYLPRVQEDLDRIKELTGKERMRARTLKILFGHLNLDTHDVMELGEESDDHPSEKEPESIEDEGRKKKERLAKMNSAATNLTTQFRDWWTQDEYIFHFSVDGQYFHIGVSDTKRPVHIELESRSKGLQWFFSFFLVFLAESKDQHRNCILLLDEPGLSLHPNAQQDLIKFFDNLSKKNQLIYTTHLPFLVDHNRLDRVKAVYTENGLTKASNDISRADRDKKAIQPVNAAIGIAASQSLLIGCDIVIVEGITDQFYLTMIKNYLVSKSKFKPKREIVFIPVGGASSVKPVVSIIQGSARDLPVVVLDSDESGKKFKQSLEQSIYKENKNKILEIENFTDKSEAEIEDLLPIKLVLDCFDRLFKPDNVLQEESIKPKKPIIPQLKEIAQNENIEFYSGWKGDLSRQIKQKFDGKVEESIEDSWKKLFDALQKAQK